MKEILIETQRIGHSMRVTAVDPESGTEVTFQVPASVGRADIQALAVRKLKYVLSKK